MYKNVYCKELSHKNIIVVYLLSCVLRTAVCNLERQFSPSPKGLRTKRTSDVNLVQKLVKAANPGRATVSVRDQRSESSSKAVRQEPFPLTH